MNRVSVQVLVLILILAIPLSACATKKVSTTISTRAVFVGLGLRYSAFDLADVAFVNAELGSAGLRDEEAVGWLIFLVPFSTDYRLVFMPLNQGYDLSESLRKKIIDRVESLLDQRLREKHGLLPRGPNKAPEPTPGSVMPRAEPRVTPAPCVAHL